jgi:hypothetical protein
MAAAAAAELAMNLRRVILFLDIAASSLGFRLVERARMYGSLPGQASRVRLANAR